jgi:hypothetical protein
LLQAVDPTSIAGSGGYLLSRTSTRWVAFRSKVL